MQNKIMILSIVFFFLFDIQPQAQNELPCSVFLGQDCHLGLQDQNDKMVLPAEYASIITTPIGNDWLVTAKKLNHFSYFLLKENQLVQLKYPKVEKLNDRLLKVGQIGEYGIVNTDGKGILLMNYEAIISAGPTAAITLYKKSYGVVGLDGQTIIQNKYSQLKHWEIGGFWAFESGRFQLIDPRGTLVKGAKYDAIGRLSQDLSICAVANKGKWGVINNNNELVLDLVYDEIKLLDIGLVAVMKSKKQQLWQLMDIKGQLISEQSFDKVEQLGSQAVLVSHKNKLGLLDKQAKVLLPMLYNSITYVGNDWVALSKEEEVVRIFSINEKKILEPAFEAIRAGNNLDICTGILIQQDKKWGWFDFNKSISIKPVYANANFYLKTKTIIVEGENREIGSLNTKGEMVLPIEYTVIVPKGEFFKVKKKGTDWYYVNKKNKKLTCNVY